MYNTGMKPHKPIPLKVYDYSRAGTYFFTIYTQNKECIFGDITNGGLNDFVLMVDTEIKTAKKT